MTRTNVIVTGVGFAYDFKDGNGKCVRANSSGQVKIESTGCNTSDDGELWVVTSCTEIMGICTTGYGSKYRFENVLQESWMKTTGYVPGDKVWVGTGGANDWDLYPV